MLCARAAHSAWYAKHPEVLRAKDKRRCAKRKLQRPFLPEEVRERERRRLARQREKNPERAREWGARHARKYPAKMAFKAAFRRARRRSATPKWADKNAIQAIYRECAEITRATGIQHHVDHIVPLISDVVCGLHITANLQIITATENARKQNRLIAV